MSVIGMFISFDRVILLQFYWSRNSRGKELYLYENINCSIIFNIRKNWPNYPTESEYLKYDLSQRTSL